MFIDICSRLYFWCQFFTPPYVQALCHINLQCAPTVDGEVSTPDLRHMLHLYHVIQPETSKAQASQLCLCHQYEKNMLKLVPWSMRMTDMWRRAQPRLANYSQLLMHE